MFYSIGVIWFLDRGFLCIGNVSSQRCLRVLAFFYYGNREFDRAKGNTDVLCKKTKHIWEFMLLRGIRIDCDRLVLNDNCWFSVIDVWFVAHVPAFPPHSV